MEKATEKMARIVLEDAERAHEFRESLDKAQSAMSVPQCVHDVWNHDISAAPRGKMVPYTRKGKDGPVQSEQYRKEYILAVDVHGDVYQSYWIPPRHTQAGTLLEGNRWSGFNPGVDPIAWAPWPEYVAGHPVADDPDPVTRALTLREGAMLLADDVGGGA